MVKVIFIYYFLINYLFDIYLFCDLYIYNVFFMCKIEVEIVIWLGDCDNEDINNVCKDFGILIWIM